MLVGPSGDRCHGLPGFQCQQSLHFLARFRRQLGLRQSGNDLVSFGAPGKGLQRRPYDQQERECGGLKGSTVGYQAPHWICTVTWRSNPAQASSTKSSTWSKPPGPP